MHSLSGEGQSEFLSRESSILFRNTRQITYPPSTSFFLETVAVSGHFGHHTREGYLRNSGPPSLVAGAATRKGNRRAMLQNTSTANRPRVPTLAEIEQRRAELHHLANRPQPKPLRQPPEPEIDPSSAKQSRHPTPRPECPQPVLAEAALHGLVGATGALSVSSQPTTGRSSTLWSPSQKNHRMEMEESPEDDEPAEDE